MPTLPEFIAKIGDDKAAKLFSTRGRRVKARTAMSWRLRTRFPTKDQADVIVKKCEVTYDGIYSVERKKEAA